MRKLTLLLLLNSIILSANAQYWTKVTNYPKSASYDWPRVSTINTDTVVIANDSGLFMSRDNGGSWIMLKDSVNESRWLNSRVGLTDNYDWMNSNLYYTTNSGNTWSVVASDLSSEFGFTEDKGIYYLITSGSNDVFKKSIDGGTTWTSIQLPSNYNFRKVAYANGDSLVLQADSTWSDYFLFRTPDAGATWEMHFLPGVYYLPEVKAKDYNSILLLSDSSVIKTTDGGANLQRIPVTTSMSFTEGLSVYGDLVAVGCSTNTDGTKIIARSTDFFTTWNFDTIQNYTGSYGVDDIDLVNPNYGWASSFDNLYKYNSLTVGLEDIKLQSDSNIVHVFPNPAQDKFSLKWKKEGEFSRLVIYNVKGEEVLNQLLGENQNRIDLNTDWKRGIYFCRLIGESKTEGIKLVKH